jgi:GNAT superfamily N-acetyltransferase
VIVEEITWEEILPVWKDKLWPGRISKIDPASAITYPGGKDRRNTVFTPTYFAIKTDKIIAVNSVIMCYDGGARSRGLWVDPVCRGQGLAKAILSKTIEKATQDGATYLWTMPRQSALPAYVSVGFEQTTDWFDEGVEFGPNCYARMMLTASSTDI